MNRRKIQDLKYELEAITHFEKIFLTSCKTGYGIPELIEYMEDSAPKAIHHATPNKKTQGTEIDVINDIIKAAIMQRYYYEIPYNIVYNCIEFLVKSNGRIKVTIQLNVLKKHQRHIVYGPKGRSIRAVADDIKYEVAKRYGQACEVWMLVFCKPRQNRLWMYDNRHEKIVDDDYSLVSTEEGVKGYKEKIRELYRGEGVSGLEEKRRQDLHDKGMDIPIENLM